VAGCLIPSFKLAAFGGMRPGEILALKWKHLSDESAKIEQRVYRGQIDTPKIRTSKRAIATRLQKA
jgi:integrase